MQFSKASGLSHLGIHNLALANKVKSLSLDNEKCIASVLESNINVIKLYQLNNGNLIELANHQSNTIALVTSLLDLKNGLILLKKADDTIKIITSF